MAGTDGKGYISPDGAVLQIDPAGREAPVSLSGKTLTGQPLDLADYRGRPVVVNIWGSWCAECRAEARELVSAAKQLGSTATFVGITNREVDPAAPRAYEREYAVPYPSIFDREGTALLAFRGKGAPTGTPTTLVLDDRGRVAAVVGGTLPSEQTLVDLVDQVARGQ